MIGNRDTNKSPIRPQGEAYNMDDELKDVTRDAFDDLVLGDREFEEWVQEPKEEADGIMNNPGKNTTGPNVKNPTKQEIIDHEKLHLPFRSWCKSCVKG